MFILYKIQEDLYLPAEQYTQHLARAVKDAVFKKYLFKITPLGVCVRIKSIEIKDNVILRKDAEMLVRLVLELLVVKLMPEEYFEGEVVEFDEKNGVVVSFLGILEGRIPPKNMHEGSLYNGTNWIMPFDKDKAFTWRQGEKVRFRVESTGNTAGIQTGWLGGPRCRT
jgi:DNA-directed RNA polymerase subunit E'/Rpb7